MTKEETIKWLESLKTEIGKSEHRSLWHYAEVIDMAISALSADALLKQEIDFHKEVSRSEAEKVVDLEHKLADAVSREEYEELYRKAKEVNGMANDILADFPSYKELVSADAVQGWIPCSERLPKINQRVLLATNEERVFVGYKEKPDIVWRVTEADGREHWVYDPENYTDDIDVLPKDEDCGFAKDDVYADGFLSVTSINYDDRFEGVIAWMPLPEPYKAESEEEE